MFARQRLVAGQRGIEIGGGDLDQALELRQFVVGEGCDLGIRKTAENEIHFAGAAMPAAKQQPLAAVIEAAARSCRSRHCPNSIPTPKARTCRARVDIAMEKADVSTCVARIIGDVA